MTLKTTTWKDRNLDNLGLTLENARNKGLHSPHIINFGPGGSVSFMAKYLPQGPTASLSNWHKFIRIFESFLRKTGLFSLKTNEPLELLSVFSPLEPASLAVYDREPKVIAAVENLARTGQLTVPLHTAVMDLQLETVEGKADIVVALNIVSRTNDRESALMNIMHAARPGGLICINIDDPPEGFRKLGHCLFERTMQLSQTGTAGEPAAPQAEPGV